MPDKFDIKLDDIPKAEEDSMKDEGLLHKLARLATDPIATSLGYGKSLEEYGHPGLNDSVPGAMLKGFLSGSLGAIKPGHIAAAATLPAMAAEIPAAAGISAVGRALQVGRMAKLASSIPGPAQAAAGLGSAAMTGESAIQGVKDYQDPTKSKFDVGMDVLNTGLGAIGVRSGFKGYKAAKAMTNPSGVFGPPAPTQGQRQQSLQTALAVLKDKPSGATVTPEVYGAQALVDAETLKNPKGPTAQAIYDDVARAKGPNSQATTGRPNVVRGVETPPSVVEMEKLHNQGLSAVAKAKKIAAAEQAAKEKAITDQIMQTKLAEARVGMKKQPITSITTPLKGVDENGLPLRATERYVIPKEEEGVPIDEQEEAALGLGDKPVANDIPVEETNQIPYGPEKAPPTPPIAPIETTTWTRKGRPTIDRPVAINGGKKIGGTVWTNPAILKAKAKGLVVKGSTKAAKISEGGVNPVTDSIVNQVNPGQAPVGNGGTAPINALQEPGTPLGPNGNGFAPTPAQTAPVNPAKIQPKNPLEGLSDPAADIQAALGDFKGKIATAVGDNKLNPRDMAPGQFTDQLKNSLKGRKGEFGGINPALAVRLGGSIAGSVVGNQSDPLDNKVGSTLLGAGLGAVTPEMAGLLAKAVPVIGEAGVNNQEKIANFAKFVNQIHNSSLLSPISVLKKLAGDAGGLGLAALENPDHAGEILRQFASSEGRAGIKAAFKTGLSGPDRGVIEGLEPGAGYMKGLDSNKNPLSWSGKAMSGLTTATKHILNEAGLGDQAQRYYSLTDYPHYKTTENFYNAIRQGEFAKHLIPFARVGMNRIERGYEYSPLGLANLLMKRHSEDPTGTIKKALLGTVGAMGAYSVTPENFVKEHPIAASVGSSLAGPLGLPVLGAMALKNSHKQSHDPFTASPDVSKLADATGELARDIPGLRLLEDASGKNPQGFARNYLSGYTNSLRPIALAKQYLETGSTQDPDLSSKDLTTTQKLTNRTLSNIPFVREMLPQKKVSLTGKPKFDIKL